ncbi:MAG: transcriptional repressor LexA [Clostridia bacterium]
MRKISDELLNKVKDFLGDYIDNYGYPPSVREVCDGLDIKSTATAFKYIAKLDEMGVLVKSKQKTRALQLTERQFKKDDFSIIPLVGKIAAGTPITAIENVEDTFCMPTKLFGANTFMLKIQGTSMIDAGIFNGDNVIIEKTESAENGEIVAVLVDDSATLKRFYKENGRYRLHPENSAMDDIYVTECEIIGKLVGLLRKY